ncbi:hypothetical protein [Roseibium sp.]|uniref:hypothetical protein n=1 Tax=Roseibium sp. TaxID=1936156 RepID=UPI003D0F6EBB
MPARLERGGLNASPSYPHSHSGPVLVCGNAWCLHDDLERARKIYPDAPCIAINGASKEVKAFALYSWHPDRFMETPFRWIERQRVLFGEGFEVHGARTYQGMPWVEYWWPDTKKGGGGSAWGARKMAWLMGFETVVLCGCPLTPGPYVGNHGLGGLMTKDNVVQMYIDQIVRDGEWHDGVYSMSGRTRDVLGEPKPC